MSYRDRSLPDRPHRLVVDSVLLAFGAGGLLEHPRAEQITAMTATGQRRERFVLVPDEVSSEKPTVPPARGPAEALSATPVETPPEAPTETQSEAPSGETPAARRKRKASTEEPQS